jgi:hypothetical protein
VLSVRLVSEMLPATTRRQFVVGGCIMSRLPSLSGDSRGEALVWGLCISPRGVRYGILLRRRRACRIFRLISFPNYQQTDPLGLATTRYCAAYLSRRRIWRTNLISMGSGIGEALRMEVVD